MPSCVIPSGEIFKLGLYTFLTGALAFVVAFAWNAAFQELLATVINPKNQVCVKFIFAIVITVAIIFVIFWLAQALNQKVNFCPSG